MQPRSSSEFFVPSDTILDSGRVFRRPLHEWAWDLTTRIEQLIGQVPKPDTIDRGCSVLNNAALVFVHAGLSAIAEEICHSQLAWINTHTDYLNSDELSILSIQPRVNLGRLCRRAREYTRAREYYEAIRPEAGSEAYRAAAEPAYVYEVLRTYQQSGNLAEGMAFANGLWVGLLRSSLILKTELSMHIVLLQNDGGDLYHLLKEMPWPEDQFGLLAKYFYTAVALNGAGRKEACLSALKRMVPRFVSYLHRAPLDSRDLRFGLETIRFAKYLNRRDLLILLLPAVCSAIFRSRDVIFGRQLLSLTQGEKLTETDETFRALRRFVEQSDYVQCSETPIAPETGRRLKDLFDAFTRLVGDPNRTFPVTA